jgi:hypothetical protein
MERDLGGELQPAGVGLAVVVRPVVVGAGQGRGERGIEIVVHEHLAAARPVENGHVDALDVHGDQVRGRVEAGGRRHLVVRVPGERAPVQVGGGPH